MAQPCLTERAPIREGSLQTEKRLVPLAIDCSAKISQLEGDYSVCITSTRENVPLRRRGKRVYLLRLDISGTKSWEALWDFDNWLESIGMI